MANLVISEKLLQQLRSMAERQQRTVEELAEEALEHFVEATVGKDEHPAPGTFAALAKSASEANLSSAQPVNTAERSREILETEYFEYIIQRNNVESDDEANSD